jgi:uncharacterized protein YidB (DUF937 family)
MGLLDSVLGGLAGNSAGDGQSSLLGNKKVLLAAGLLAYLAMKHGNAPAGDAAAQGDQGGGLLGSLGSLAGMLGGAGALGGGNADHAAVDAAAPGGLGPLQQILEQAGLGDQVRSWIGNGQNLPVSGEQITQALGGSGALSQLASTFGVNEGEIANQLAEGLPEAVNHLTPNGTLPSA